jgi:hypothetical protein
MDAARIRKVVFSLRLSGLSSGADCAGEARRLTLSFIDNDDIQFITL